MNYFSTSSRRFSIFLYSLLLSAQSLPLSTTAVQWGSLWWTNRSTVFMITLVNTTITAGSELVSRTVSAPFAAPDAQGAHFFIRNETGHYRIHQQSLTSIFMTFFASLLGGPVFFMRRRKARFLFFAYFGLFNSILSQVVSTWATTDLATLSGARLLFDLAYNGSFKYFMFEIGRPLILRWRRSISLVGTTRIVQDLITTLFKVTTLNVLGFPG